MTYRFRWFAFFSVGGLASIAGCSSTSGPSAPAAQNDAAVGGDAGAGMDAPAQQMCAAVSLTPMANAAMASCFACQASMCAPELAVCATDCTCGPSYQCLEAHGNDYTMCPEAMTAIFNTNQALTNVAGCASSPGKCGGPCFGNDGG